MRTAKPSLMRCLPPLHARGDLGGKRHEPRRGEEIGHRQGRAAPAAVSLPLLRGQFPRPGECRLRRALYERRSRLQPVGVRRRRRHLFRRLYPVRDSEQSGDAEIRRAHLDRAHHDQLGHRRHRHGLCQRREELLCDALSLGRRGSGVLPRHHPLSHLLVSGAGARAHRLAVHGGGAACHHGRRTGVGCAAGDARAARAEGLALAVHRRGAAGGDPRRDRAQVSRRPARAGAAGSARRSGRRSPARSRPRPRRRARRAMPSSARRSRGRACSCSASSISASSSASTA